MTYKDAIASLVEAGIPCTLSNGMIVGGSSALSEGPLTVYHQGFHICPHPDGFLIRHSGQGQEVIEVITVSLDNAVDYLKGKKGSTPSPPA